MDAPTTIAGILELILPLDNFVDAPVSWMDRSVQPGAVLSVHSDVLEVSAKAEARENRTCRH